jgi:hypothetical protein
LGVWDGYAVERYNLVPSFLRSLTSALPIVEVEATYIPQDYDGFVALPNVIVVYDRERKVRLTRSELLAKVQSARAAALQAENDKKAERKSSKKRKTSPSAAAAAAAASAPKKRKTSVVAAAIEAAAEAEALSAELHEALSRELVTAIRMALRVRSHRDSRVATTKNLVVRNVGAGVELLTWFGSSEGVVEVARTNQSVTFDIPLATLHEEIDELPTTFECKDDTTYYVMRGSTCSIIARPCKIVSDPVRVQLIPSKHDPRLKIMSLKTQLCARTP